MIGDTWRIVRRRVPIAGIVLQPCVMRPSGATIPIGPWAETIEELRADVQGILAACDEPILEMVE